MSFNNPFDQANLMPDHNYHIEGYDYSGLLGYTFAKNSPKLTNVHFDNHSLLPESAKQSLSKADISMNGPSKPDYESAPVNGVYLASTKQLATLVKIDNNNVHHSFNHQYMLPLIDLWTRECERPSIYAVTNVNPYLMLDGGTKYTKLLNKRGYQTNFDNGKPRFVDFSKNAFIYYLENKQAEFNGVIKRIENLLLTKVSPTNLVWTIATHNAFELTCVMYFRMLKEDIFKQQTRPERQQAFNDAIDNVNVINLINYVNSLMTTRLDDEGNFNFFDDLLDHEVIDRNEEKPLFVFDAVYLLWRRKPDQFAESALSQLSAMCNSLKSLHAILGVVKVCLHKSKQALSAVLHDRRLTSMYIDLETMHGGYISTCFDLKKTNWVESIESVKTGQKFYHNMWMDFPLYYGSKVKFIGRDGRTEIVDLADSDYVLLRVHHEYQPSLVLLSSESLRLEKDNMLTSYFDYVLSTIDLFQTLKTDARTIHMLIDYTNTDYELLNAYEMLKKSTLYNLQLTFTSDLHGKLFNGLDESMFLQKVTFCETDETIGEQIDEHISTAMPFWHFNEMQPLVVSAPVEFKKFYQQQKQLPKLRKGTRQIRDKTLYGLLILAKDKMKE